MVRVRKQADITLRNIDVDLPQEFGDKENVIALPYSR